MASAWGGKIFVSDISPWMLDGVLLSILLGHEPILKPLFGPVSSNPLDSCLPLIIILLWISLVYLNEIRRQINGGVAMALSATLSNCLVSCHLLQPEGLQTEWLQNRQMLRSAGQTGTVFRGVNVTLQTFCK